MHKLSTYLSATVLVFTLIHFANAAVIEIPANVDGVPANGSGSAADPYIYNFAGGDMDLGNDTILNTGLVSGTGDTVFTNVANVTYGVGGYFDFSGQWAVDAKHRPPLSIYATGNVSNNTVDMRSKALNSYGGAYTVVTTGGDIDLVDIYTEGSGNQNSGDINLTANGAVRVSSTIDTEGGKGGGDVIITASSITLGDTIYADGNGNVAPGTIVLTSTSGNIDLSGTIQAMFYKCNGSSVTISSAGDVNITGNIDAYYANGNDQNEHTPSTVDITSGGDVEIGGKIDTRQEAVDAYNAVGAGGAITIAACSNISFTGDTAIDTSVDKTNETSFGGNVSITATNGNITILGSINIGYNNALSGTNGDLTLSAANGTITLASLDVSKVGLLTFTSQADGIIVTGAIDNLTVDQGAQTVKGGFKDGTIDSDISYYESINASLTNSPYSILDKDTSADTGYDMVAIVPPPTADVYVPDPISGVSPSGNGAPATPYTYDFGNGPLVMSITNVYNTNTLNAGYTVFTNITTVTYSNGGGFNWSADDVSSRPYLYLYASGDVNNSVINMSCTGTETYNGGNVKIMSTGGDINIVSLATSASGSGASGDATISAGGSVYLGSINLTGSKAAGDLMVTGTAITVGNTIYIESHGNNAPGVLEISATSGSISVTGGVSATIGKCNGASITMSATDDITLTEDINAYISNGNDGAGRIPTPVIITSGGSITIGGKIDTSQNGGDSDEDVIGYGGDITITANDDVSISGMLDTSVDKTNTASEAGNIDITANAGDISIGGLIDCVVHNYDSGTNGNVTLSAPNGTITLGPLDVAAFGNITLTSMKNGIAIDGEISNLTVDQGPQTVKGGFTNGSINSHIKYILGENTSLTNAPYRILDRDTSADTGFTLCTFYPPPSGTVIMVK